MGEELFNITLFCESAHRKWMVIDILSSGARAVSKHRQANMGNFIGNSYLCVPANALKSI